jgi:hypothetical protein
MLERGTSIIAESQADHALADGRFEFGREVLRTALFAFSTDPTQKYKERFIKLKQIAVPFYEAVYELEEYGSITDTTSVEVQEVHASSIDLMRDTYKKYIDAKGRERAHLKGDLAEEALFGLGARGFNLHGRRFLLPSMASENIDPERPIDFYAIDTNHRNKGGLRRAPVQLKTDVHAPHVVPVEDKGVRMVGIRQIDQHTPPPLGRTKGYDFEHDNSIVNLLIREIDGIASDGDLGLLGAISKNFYDTVYRGKF